MKYDEPYAHPYLLFMSSESSLWHDTGCPYISLENEAISTAWWQHVSIPGQRPYPTCVTLQYTDTFASSHVPDLHVTFMSTHSNKLALWG